ncbi:sensor domain-containing diguanylate cyclase [Halolactibacillus sp. JCM 19043]|uniref:sensor domain-containing diguanylate cyclase n=1 Tax=Halolactibacillus sp. JCM 19043 TaxID=1460638 RepID=UPI000785B8DC|nr:sensor domain-containing diguanylate cyclase [Halolactibacillus sp. JCM 19043]
MRMTGMWKFMLLLLLGIVLRQWDVQVSYSLYLPLYFFVPILALRLCRLQYAVVLTSLLSILFIFMGDPIIFHLMMVVHVFVIGVLYERFRRNLFTWTIAYTLIGFGASYVAVQLLVDSNSLELLYKVEVLSYWLMLLFVSLLTDVLFLILPQLPLFNRLPIKREPVRFNELIFMGVNLVAILPLILITIVQSMSLEHQMLMTFDDRTEALESVLTEQINRLDETEIQRLEIGSAIDRGRLTEVIDRHIGTREEYMYILNTGGEVFLRSSLSDQFDVFNQTLSKGVIYQPNDDRHVWLSRRGMTPRDWYHGYVVSELTVLNRPAYYFIRMADAVVEQMKAIYYYHILMLIVFLTSFVIGLLSERVLLNQIEGITRMADQIPRRMMHEHPTQIPSTRILEVKILAERLAKVDKQLRRMFKELTNTNRELNEKTSELNASRKELYHVAHHDALTDLPNRRLFYHTLEKKIDREDSFALFFLDLDDFKAVNDRYGHKEGDTLLKRVGDRLKSLETEFPVRFYRLAGDEFVAILKRDHHEDVAFFTKTLKKTFSTTFYIAGEEQQMSVSIGLSLMPEDGSTFEELLHIADQSMYEDKKVSKGKE